MVVNAGMPLTPEQHSLIVGTLLGDGSMRCKANALLEVNHSARQRDYVDWKYRVLGDLVATPPRLRPTNGTRVAYRFVTRSLPALTPYYRMFYATGRKSVPDVEITPLALAVWLMDDGSRSYRAVYFNTQQFDLADQVRLIEILDRQFSIVARLNRDKSYYRLRVAVDSVPRLRSLVSAYVRPELAYKIPD
jgi:hypothetical protein